MTLTKQVHTLETFLLDIRLLSHLDISLARYHVLRT